MGWLMGFFETERPRVRLIWGLRIAVVWLLAALFGSAQNKPDPMAGSLPGPIEQLQADREWCVYAAVVTHDHRALHTLLEGGDSPNGIGGTKGEPLAMASGLGDFEAVKILVEGGADINLFDAADVNALFEATGANHPEIVHYFLSHGAKVDARRRSEGETALFRALGNGNLNHMTVLIQAGADVNLRNKAGDTLLMVASLRDEYEMVKFLKANSAKFNSPNEELTFAASHGYVADIQRVLAAGAKVNQAYEGGITPLMVAAQNGQTDAVKALIAAGADMNALDTDAHDTLLMFAIKSRHKSTILALLDAGADPTLVDLGGATTLLFAAEYMDDPELVNLLIHRSVPANGGSNINQTPLMAAASFGAIRTA
jgi:ankyrin repeat protein